MKSPDVRLSADDNSPVRALAAAFQRRPRQAVLPNLFVVGSAKAGTTAIYEYFKHHPQVFVHPVVKEANYMAFHDRRPDFRGPGDQEIHDKSTITTFAAYTALYQIVTTEPVIADVSPAYMTFPRAAQKISELCPLAKIVIVLRNPVECAFSMYSMLRRDRREPCDEFRHAFHFSAKRQADNWGRAWDYQNGYRFSEQLPHYLALFPPSQMFIRRYEHLKLRPESFYQELCDFLGIATIDIARANRPMNVGCTKRDRLRSTQLGRWAVRALRVAGVLAPPLTQRWMERNLSKPALVLSREDRKLLIDHYRSDILKVGRLLAWDLNDWLTV